MRRRDGSYVASSCSQDESACWDILKLNVKNAEAWFCRAERDHYIALIRTTLFGRKYWDVFLWELVRIRISATLSVFHMKCSSH